MWFGDFGVDCLPFFLPMLHVRRFAPMKGSMNVSWEAGVVVAAADGCGGKMLVVEDRGKIGVLFLKGLGFLLLLLLVFPLLLHVLKMNLGFGFGWDDNGDSFEDPDSDPCCAFLVPAFD